MVNLQTEAIRVAVKELFQGTPGHEHITDVLSFRDTYTDSLTIRLVMPYYIHDIKVPVYMIDNPTEVIKRISNDIQEMEKIRYKAYDAQASKIIEDILTQ